MAVPTSISTAPPDNPGLDYAALRAEGIRIIQRQARRTWTDHNESDPGITTLEQLCYALTELSYRAEFPLADLLIGEPGGTVDPRRQALYLAGDAFPVNPVIPDDYRRLLIDRVPGVANAWAIPYRPAPDAPRGVNGLYDLLLLAPGIDPHCDRRGERGVLEAARRVYCAHRNLCEDVRSIVLLAREPVSVHAEVAIDGAASPDEVMASLLFRLGLLYAPEPARRPLDALIREGLAPSRIFEGPLLLNGFIADSELTPRLDAVPVQDAVRTVSATPGVAGVRRLSVVARGRRWTGDEAVPVPRRGILWLDTGAGRSGYPIRLYCNGVEVRPDPGRVERRLRRLRAAHRRTYPLEDQYAEAFGIPPGRYRDLRAYASIQNQFPSVYGIDAYGLPSGAPAVRRGQARQLKGYLLPFEQLMTDFFAQLAHVRDLFSTLGPEDPEGARSYWFQYLDRSVPDVEPLFRVGEDGYHQELPRIVASQDPWVARRSGFLSFLLSLYADGLDPDDVAGPGGEACGGSGAGERSRSLYEARLRLLRRLMEVDRDRGRGFDYLRRPSSANVAGMEIRCRIQLGMPLEERRPFGQLLRETGVELRPGSDWGEGTLEWEAEHIERAFDAVAPAPGGEPPHPAGAEGGVHLLSEAVLDAAPGPGDLRVGILPGESGFTAVVRAGDGWRRVGRYPDREGAALGARRFASALHWLRRHARQLYVVEHLLLRAGRYRCGAAGPEFGQALTAVFFLPQRLLADASYREMACRIVRDTAPAHLAVEYCFLPLTRAPGFELLLREWQRALESGDRRSLRRSSARMADFLAGCGAPVPRS